MRRIRCKLTVQTQKTCEKYDKNDKLDRTTADHSKKVMQDPWFVGGLLI